VHVEEAHFNVLDARSPEDRKGRSLVKLSSEHALQTLRETHADFARLLEGDAFDVGIYKPDKVDLQGPHVRDELYVVASGRGRFRCDGETQPVGVSDVLFVRAGVEHRFEDFTDDFSAWVVFFGPRPAH
jgi:mannose-6-phosphate isomerase-like protein (cupin superfamily)